MPRKVFMEREGFTLWGDERDVMVSTDLRGQVLSWCWSNSVKAEPAMNRDNQEIARAYFGVDLWRVKNEKQRSIFVLRWAK